MSGLHEQDIEALLGGRAPGGLEHLAALVERVRREADLPVEPATARQHVIAAAAAAWENPASLPTLEAPGRPTWRRRTVFAGLLSTIFGKIFLGAVAVAAATAGAGAAGVLPDPIQGFVEGNQEIHQITDQIRDQEQLQLHEQEQLGDQQQIRDQEQLQLHEQEQLGDQQQIRDQEQLQLHEQEQLGDQQQIRDQEQGGAGAIDPQQQQQQRQGLDDEENATQQQQQQQGTDASRASTQTQEQAGTQTQTQEQAGTQTQSGRSDAEPLPGGGGH
ncbi:MAG TPA: hypothetical protein VLS92_08930 [Acidimicrobiia bacterium]|nr:hypothetical protein [Acidimicrobiia bacterium]